jgi:hypothetical protein
LVRNFKKTKIIIKGMRRQQHGINRFISSYIQECKGSANDKIRGNIGIQKQAEIEKIF